MTKKYEYLEHPADLKIQAFGKDLPELFMNAALGMMNFLYDIQETTAVDTDLITVEGIDLDALFVNWLAELLYLSDTNHCAYIHFHFKEFGKTKIIVQISSVKAEAKEDIKAITFHELEINKKNDRWSAIFVCDI